MTGQEGDNKNLSVSNIQTVSTTEYMLTVAQNQTRSAKLTANGSGILYPYLVCLANRLHTVRKRLLTYTLQLGRERGN